MSAVETEGPDAKYLVCPVCVGEGFTSKLGAFTAADLDEWFGGDLDDREDFRVEYTRRGGVYDEPCAACKGQRVITHEELARHQELAQIDHEMRAESRWA